MGSIFGEKIECSSGINSSLLEYVWVAASCYHSYFFRVCGQPTRFMGYHGQCGFFFFGCLWLRISSFVLLGPLTIVLLLLFFLCLGSYSKRK